LRSFYEKPLLYVPELDAVRDKLLLASLTFDLNVQVARGLSFIDPASLST
jgi:hypothetical protein